MLGAFGVSTTSNLLVGLGESALNGDEDTFSSIMWDSTRTGAFSSVGAGAGGGLTMGLTKSSWLGPRSEITESAIGFGAGGGEVVGGIADRLAGGLLDWLSGADASCTQDVTDPSCEYNCHLLDHRCILQLEYRISCASSNSNLSWVYSYSSFGVLAQRGSVLSERNDVIL